MEKTYCRTDESGKNNRQYNQADTSGNRQVQ